MATQLIPLGRFNPASLSIESELGQLGEVFAQNRRNATARTLAQQRIDLDRQVRTGALSIQQAELQLKIKEFQLKQQESEDFSSLINPPAEPTQSPGIAESLQSQLSPQDIPVLSDPLSATGGLIDPAQSISPAQVPGQLDITHGGGIGVSRIKPFTQALADTENKLSLSAMDVAGGGW